MAHGRETDHPHFTALTIARIINRLHGGTVISAFEVNQLDEDWIESMIALATDLPQKQARQKAIDAKFRQFEKEHPTYRNYKN